MPNTPYKPQTLSIEITFPTEGGYLTNLTDRNSTTNRGRQFIAETWDEHNKKLADLLAALGDPRVAPSPAA